MRLPAAVLATCLALPITQVQAFDLLDPGSWFAPSNCLTAVPSVIVSSAPAGLVIDHTRDTSQMDSTSRTLIRAARSGWTTNGLAIAELRSRADIVTNRVRLNDGRWCATLHEAHIGIGYSEPIRVLISNRYAKHSCQYRAILDHEILHVGIYRDTLAAHLTGVSGRIVERILAAGPSYGATPEMASAGVEKVLDNVVIEVIEGVKAESNVRNSVLDTDESYLAIQGRCQSW